MRQLQLAAVLAVFAATPALAQTPQPPGADLLPAGAGREVVVRVCSACHALDVISQQQHDADGWTDLVQMMRDRGARMTDAEHDQIVSYLAKAFPEPGAAQAAGGGAGGAARK